MDTIDHCARTPAAALPAASGARHGFHGLISSRRRHDAPASVLPPTALPRPMPVTTPLAGGTPLMVGVAESPEHFEAVERLIRRRYAWRGYCVDAGDENPAVRGERSRRQITFFAAHTHTTLGTITLGLDGPGGLHAEATHGDAIRGARSEGRRVGELTRLAVGEGVDSRLVLASLFGLVYAVGRMVHGVADVYIEVNPRHVRFYSRALGFVVTGSERYCERVGAPSVLLHLEVASLERRLGLAITSLTSEPMVQSRA